MAKVGEKMLIIYTLAEEAITSRNKRAESLIIRMAGGDISAMGELYDLIEKDIYAYALSRTANRENAEDVTHDTFVQIWRNARLYKSEGKPLAWIFTIEMNIIRRRYNKIKGIVSYEELGELEAEDCDFSGQIIDREFLRYLFSAIGKVEREIISLHVISGLKHREIASLLKIPLATVLSKYNRAIKKLQMKLEEGGMTGEV